MKVRTLQQFLLSLAEPLKACHPSEDVVTDIQTICLQLERLADKPVHEFAQFLQDVNTYEQEGHWPEKRPPVYGYIIDAPSAKEYAERLMDFLKTNITESSPISKVVPLELLKVKDNMKLPQLKEIATHCGVEKSFGTAQKGIEILVETVTGRKLSLMEELIRVYAQELSEIHSVEHLDNQLSGIIEVLTVPQIKKLAKQLEVQGNITTKKAATEFIRKKLVDRLQTAATEDTQPMNVVANTQEETQPTNEQSLNEHISRVLETLQALEEKASEVNAPYDEIEEELNRLGATLTKEEAIRVAKEFGIIQPMATWQDALDEIKWRVFETKRARESIEY